MRRIAFALILSALSVSLHAVTLTYVLPSDVNSYDDYGSSNNVVQNVNLGAGPVLITGVALDGIMSAYSPFVFSDLNVDINDSTVSSVNSYSFQPLFDENYSGVMVPFTTGSYSFSGGAGNLLLPDGVVNLHFYGTPALPGVPEGTWHAGSKLIFEYEAVPEPATAIVVILAVTSLVRRKRSLKRI